jgi:hypothetical protein
VRVKSLDFPRGDGAEYSTFRTYRITLEADFPDTAGNLLEYAEALDFEGTGGPRRVFLEVLEGLPQEQIGTERTTTRATQHGRAVGYGTYPVPPPPVWPAAELPHRRRISLRTPERVGNQFARYPVEWHYAFEAVVPLVGTPSGVASDSSSTRTTPRRSPPGLSTFSRSHSRRIRLDRYRSLARIMTGIQCPIHRIS